MLLPASSNIYYYDAFRKTGRDDVASRAKRALFCIFGEFPLHENSPLLVRGSAPKTPLNAHKCAAARSCETLLSVTIIVGHAHFSFPHCAHFCPAYDPHSAYG